MLDEERGADLVGEREPVLGGWQEMRLSPFNTWPDTLRASPAPARARFQSESGGPFRYLGTSARSCSIPGGFPEFRPEWKDAALGGFRRMDGAAVSAQERAQGMARHSQAQAVAGAVDVAAFKCRGGHPQKSGGARQVGFGQVHEALLAATFRASGLALETQGLDHVSL